MADSSSPAHGRASFLSGTIYAICGDDGWVYYTQVTPTRDFGFFRYRSHEIGKICAPLAADVMCRLSVDRQSVGKALRMRTWVKLGRASIHAALVGPRFCVQWSLGNTTVVVWKVAAVGKNLQSESYETAIDDPSIQAMEVAAAYDATQHIPGRLKADFGEEVPDWHIGGPVWRERRLAVERALRSPDNNASRVHAQAALLPPDH